MVWTQSVNIPEVGLDCREETARGKVTVLVNVRGESDPRAGDLTAQGSPSLSVWGQWLLSQPPGLLPGSSEVISCFGWALCMVRTSGEAGTAQGPGLLANESCCQRAAGSQAGRPVTCHCHAGHSRVGVHRGPIPRQAQVDCPTSAVTSVN